LSASRTSLRSIRHFGISANRCAALEFDTTSAGEKGDEGGR
jgi:hypothetical protein